MQIFAVYNFSTVSTFFWAIASPCWKDICIVWWIFMMCSFFPIVGQTLSNFHIITPRGENEEIIIISFGFFVKTFSADIVVAIIRFILIFLSPHMTLGYSRVPNNRNGMFIIFLKNFPPTLTACNFKASWPIETYCASLESCNTS